MARVFSSRTHQNVFSPNWGRNMLENVWTKAPTYYNVLGFLLFMVSIYLFIFPFVCFFSVLSFLVTRQLFPFFIYFKFPSLVFCLFFSSLVFLSFFMLFTRLVFFFFSSIFFLSIFFFNPHFFSFLISRSHFAIVFPCYLVGENIIKEKFKIISPHYYFVLTKKKKKKHHTKYIKIISFFSLKQKQTILLMTNFTTNPSETHSQYKPLNNHRINPTHQTPNPRPNQNLQTPSHHHNHTHF